MFKKKYFSVLIFIVFLIVFNLDVISTISDIKKCLGEFIYPLDDAYIHLSISKNLAEFSVWGITKYEFSSTSSSPLFTIIIAFFIKVFGNYSQIPLYFNLLLGNFFIFLIYRCFRSNSLLVFLIYFLFYIGVLLKIQVVSGMEHMLHITLISASWIFFYKWFSTGFSNFKYKISFFITLPFLCLARYESMFFVAAVIPILLYSRHWKESIVVALLAFLPVFIFGFYSIQQGGHFFPNSVLLKGEHSFSFTKISKIFIDAKTIILSGFYFSLISLLILLIFNNFKFLGIKDLIIPFKINMIFLVVLITVLGHLMFAKTGWFYRYDAYLIALLSLAIAFAFEKLDFKNLNLSVLVLGIFLFLISCDTFRKRYNEAEYILPLAMKNIHDQQIQMGEFLSLYYNTAKVKANDIGAIAYKTNIRLCDLVGLGSTDILNIKTLRPEKYDQYVDTIGFDVMIIYESWFSNNTIQNKQKVAELIINHNVVCGDSKVSFFIPKESNPKYLINSLKEFKKSKLPKDVSLNIIE